MEANFITLNKDTIGREHICCGFSDKKCAASYEMKKEWLKKEFDNGFVFRRLNERAKVFIEYVPAEKSWIPVEAPHFLLINCFWVSGQYKGKGYGKALLESAIEDAKRQGKDGLACVVGIQKFHFMADGKWLQHQGFETVEKLSSGFDLLVKKISPNAITPHFKESVLSGECPEKNGIVVYFSNRCPFTEYHVTTSLKETAKKRNLALKIMKLDSMEAARSAPTPATIFSLFLNGKFITTDVSVCMDSRFDKIIKVK